LARSHRRSADPQHRITKAAKSGPRQLVRNNRSRMLMLMRKEDTRLRRKRRPHTAAGSKRRTLRA